MQGFLRFNKGLLKMPIYAQLWVMLLMVFNMVIPLFYLGLFEAKLVLAVFMFSAMLMALITSRTGFSRLLGAGHFAWFPLLAFLLTRLESFPAEQFTGLWLRGLIVVNMISLVIDVVDVARYMRGDKEEMVQGL